MTTDYQIKEQDKLHFLTLQVVGWIDIFSKEKFRKIIIVMVKILSIKARCLVNKGEARCFAFN